MQADKESESMASTSGSMNPSGDVPESNVNGQTQSVQPPPSTALRSKSKPKKAPEIPSIERRNWLIHHHYVRKEFEVCKAIIRQQLEETRGMCEYANFIQGIILRHEGKIQESLEMFQVCNILNPNSADHIKQMARSLFLLGRHKLAIDAYRQAEARSDKPDWEIYHNLGVCHMYLKEYDEAKEELIKALGLHKTDQTFLHLGRVHLLQGDIPGAIEVYKRAVASSPENPDLNANLGLLYMQINEHALAFEHLGTSMAFDPKNAKAILAAGSMMQQHNDFDVALAKYRVASKEISESPQLWNNIGMCFFGKKKLVAAISCLKRANYLAPFDWKILFNLGLVHLAMQQFASAFHFLSASINLKPARGQTFMLLAGNTILPILQVYGKVFLDFVQVALTHLEDRENAAAAYEQAMQLDTKDPAIPLNYAILHFNQNKSEEAKMLLTQQLEPRILELRQSMMDADPDVLHVASELANKLNIDLKVAGNRKLSGVNQQEVKQHDRGQSSRTASASVKSARAALKAQMKAEGVSKRAADEEVTFAAPSTQKEAEMNE